MSWDTSGIIQEFGVAIISSLKKKIIYTLFLSLLSVFCMHQDILLRGCWQQKEQCPSLSMRRESKNVLFLRITDIIAHCYSTYWIAYWTWIQPALTHTRLTYSSALCWVWEILWCSLHIVYNEVFHAARFIHATLIVTGTGKWVMEKYYNSWANESCIVSPSLLFLRVLMCLLSV